MENFGAIITLTAFAVAVGALYAWGKREQKKEQIQARQNPQKAA